MRIVGWSVLIAVAMTLAGCPQYKPYLPEEYRVPADEPSPTLPGLFTGKKGGYVIYGK